MSISTGANPFKQKPPRPRKNLSTEDVEERQPIRASGREEGRNPIQKGGSQTIRVQPDTDVRSHRDEAASSSDSGQGSRKRKGQE